MFYYMTQNSIWFCLFMIHLKTCFRLSNFKLNFSYWHFISALLWMLYIYFMLFPSSIHVHTHSLVLLTQPAANSSASSYPLKFNLVWHDSYRMWFDLLWFDPTDSRLTRLRICCWWKKELIDEERADRPYPNLFSCMNVHSRIHCMIDTLSILSKSSQSKTNNPGNQTRISELLHHCVDWFIERSLLPSSSLNIHTYATKDNRFRQQQEEEIAKLSSPRFHFHWNSWHGPWRMRTWSCGYIHYSASREWRWVIETWSSVVGGWVDQLNQIKWKYKRVWMFSLFLFVRSSEKIWLRTLIHKSSAY